MTPKKKISERKRTPFPREVLYTNGFVNDWEKLERSGRHDMNRIKEVISLLVKNDGSLGNILAHKKTPGHYAPGVRKIFSVLRCR